MINVARKKFSRINVPMIKTTDMEGRIVIDSRSIETTFDNDGTLTLNKNNGILTWNAGDITHLNFTSDNFMIMFDAESNIITLTSGEKNIYYDLNNLKQMIQDQGLTIEEMEKILNAKGDTQNGQTEESN